MEKEKIMRIMQDKRVVRALIDIVDRPVGGLATVATGIERRGTITDAYEGDDGMAYIITYQVGRRNRSHFCLFAEAIEAAMANYPGLGKHNVRFITLVRESIELTGMPSIEFPSHLRMVVRLTDDNTAYHSYDAGIPAIGELLAVLRGEAIGAETELGKMAEKAGQGG